MGRYKGGFMSDILYCEFSSLLATPVMDALSGEPIRMIRDTDQFWPSLEAKCPAIIILGNSFSPDIEEWAFKIKSHSSISAVPLVLLLDQPIPAYVPADYRVSRLEMDSKFFRAKIGYMLRISKKRPPSIKGQDERNLDIQKGMEKRLLTLYLQEQLEGISIAGNSLENSIDSLMGRLLFILNSDFCYLELKAYRQEYRRLFCSGIWQEELRNNLLQFCASHRPEELPNLTCDWVCAFPAQPEIGTKKSEKPYILFQIPVILSPEQKGFIICGSLSTDSKPVSPDIKESISAPILMTLETIFHYNRISKDTQNLYRAFTHFLPGSIIEDLLLKTSEKDLMTGEKRQVVVLFSHIRNFEYITEHNEAEHIVRFLNKHFSAMGSIIQRFGGTIDKFIGDAIFAIFGAPISYTDNANRALFAATEMIETYQKNALSYLEFPPEGFQIGIGINEGEAIIGNIGCSVKFDYTAIGDTVNLAARLESLCKHYHQDILISQILYEQIQRDYFCRLVDIARVKGKTEPSRIYSVEVYPEKYPENWRALYKKGLSMYIMGNWYLAIHYLEEAIEILPDDYPTRLFLERCEEYRMNPPENWNGAVTLNFK